jgi:hypothetical protein
MRQLNPLLFATLLLFGCQTPALDPDGVYKGDLFLYRAEQTVNTAYGSMDTFLRWEHSSRAAFSLPPHVRVPIKKAADHLRLNGKGWIESATRLVEVYKARPTLKNQESLDEILSMLRGALDEAARYMEEYK